MPAVEAQPSSQVGTAWLAFGLWLVVLLGLVVAGFYGLRHYLRQK
jgi:hypothetical protein